ncbi:hypothetical protein [Streptomyces sp. NPDC014734]|uniref:hypothetical protein n=1 Tax=Streptomyces sp. NPDC014734 TaxID=3364886 RepID=UPI0036FF12FB
MKIRTLSVLTTAVAVVMATFAPSAVSQAAAGRLVLNGVDFREPKGCNNDPHPYVGELKIQNETDVVVFVFEKSDCADEPMEMVPPGDTVTVDARSVYVPEEEALIVPS